MQKFLILFGIVVCNQLNAQQIVTLYTDSVPNSIGKIAKEEIPSMTVYLPEKERSTGVGVIIFPGGAYQFLAFEEEGTRVAEAFRDHGIAAFVVKYRLPSDATMRDKSFGPLQDAQQAIRLVRTNAAFWNIDNSRIGVVGYSAGGHLASTLGTHYSKSYIANPDKVNLRPDFMILVYPVISMDNSLTHRGSRINLLGNGPSMERVLFFSSEEQVTDSTPPTYLTHTGDDNVVDVNNSIAFYQALQKKGINAELHLYPVGNHGFTQQLPVNEWLDPMLHWLRNGGWLKDAKNDGSGDSR